MQLNDFQKSKVRFHLGYNSGAQVPAGDHSRLEEAMSLVPDNYFYDQIVYQLARCEFAWEQSQPYITNPNSDFYGAFAVQSRTEEISGDVSRTIRTTDPLKADEMAYEIYLRECDRLAETLYVANYKRPEVRAYAFERSGAEFIMAVPGPADTAVGTRIMLYENYR